MTQLRVECSKPDVFREKAIAFFTENKKPEWTVCWDRLLTDGIPVMEHLNKCLHESEFTNIGFTLVIGTTDVVSMTFMLGDVSHYLAIDLSLLKFSIMAIDYHFGLLFQKIRDSKKEIFDDIWEEYSHLDEDDLPTWDY